MNDNLQALTQKIYSEGVEKANETGDGIIADAKDKSKDIIAKAEKRAEEIIALAEKKAADSQVQHEAEMRLASRQALGLLKQKITDLIIWEVTASPIENAFTDQEFIQGLISKLIDYWKAKYGQEEQLNILLPEEDYKELQATLRSKAQQLMKDGVKIEFSGVMKNGFQISPEDGRFKVSFTSEDFENYFKTFARPRTYKLLFGEQS